MYNFLKYIKQYNSNIHSLTVSLLLALWYNGISGIINYYLPNRGICLSLFMMSIPIIIFLMDDNKLDELYRSPENQYPAMESSKAPNTSTSVYKGSGGGETGLSRKYS